MPQKHVNVPIVSVMRVASLTAALVVAGCASTTPPSASATGPLGYATDGAGNVARTGGGGCLRTGSWEPRLATPECDPSLVAQAAPVEQQPEVASAPTEPTPSQEPPAAASGDTAELVTPEPVRVFVGTDAYFVFNQAELTPDAQRKLDRIAERTQSAEEVTIQVVGYADQIGSEDYNQSLSQRRADAVRVYLIQRGVPETAVSVEARGETDPIVRCEGRQGASLIDCLQPNRRTEVEFSALETPQGG